MSTTQERLPERAIEHQCEALSRLEVLAQERTLRRNPSFARQVQEIRRHLIEANAATCRAWFLRDTLADLPPEAA